MDEDVIADLKQFITATISQQMSDVATKDDIASIRAEMATKTDITRLEQKLDELQQAVGEAVDTSNDAADARMKALEGRVSKLEQAAA
jgi:polyhydroxyalkanoate synthesis regulator phasin